MSNPSEIEVWPEHSADKLHAFGELLMAFLKVDSSLIQDPTMNFILGLLCYGRWGRSGMRQQWSTTVSGCSFSGFICNFSIFQGCPIRGARCKTSILMKSNPFSQNKKLRVHLVACV